MRVLDPCKTLRVRSVNSLGSTANVFPLKRENLGEEQKRMLEALPGGDLRVETKMLYADNIKNT